MAETMRGPLYEREPDARAIIVDQAIQSFEKREEFKVTGSARLYLIEGTLISSVEFTMAAQAVMQLISSRGDDKFWARAIAMMRHGFGGHKYGYDPATVRERRQGQISDFIRD